MGMSPKKERRHWNCTYSRFVKFSNSKNFLEVKDFFEGTIPKIVSNYYFKCLEKSLIFFLYNLTLKQLDNIRDVKTSGKIYEGGEILFYCYRKLFIWEIIDNSIIEMDLPFSKIGDTFYHHFFLSKSSKKSLFVISSSGNFRFWYDMNNSKKYFQAEVASTNKIQGIVCSNGKSNENIFVFSTSQIFRVSFFRNKCVVTNIITQKNIFNYFVSYIFPESINIKQIKQYEDVFYILNGSVIEKYSPIEYSTVSKKEILRFSKNEKVCDFIKIKNEFFILIKLLETNFYQLRKYYLLKKKFDVLFTILQNELNELIDFFSKKNYLYFITKNYFFYYQINKHQQNKEHLGKISFRNLIGSGFYNSKIYLISLQEGVKSIFNLKQQRHIPIFKNSITKFIYILFKYQKYGYNFNQTDFTEFNDNCLIKVSELITNEQYMLFKWIKQFYNTDTATEQQGLFIIQQLERKVFFYKTFLKFITIEQQEIWKKIKKKNKIFILINAEKIWTIIGIRKNQLNKQTKIGNEILLKSIKNLNSFYSKTKINELFLNITIEKKKFINSNPLSTSKLTDLYFYLNNLLINFFKEINEFREKYEHLYPNRYINWTLKKTILNLFENQIFETYKLVEKKVNERIFLDQIFILEIFLLNFYNELIVIKVEDKLLKRFYINLKQKCINIFINKKLWKQAAELSIKFKYFYGLIVISEESNEVDLNYCIKNLENMGFVDFLIDFYYKNKKFKKLLKISEGFWEKVASYLQKKYDLKWLFYIKSEMFNEAALSLNELNKRDKKELNFNSLKTRMNLMKLCYFEKEFPFQKELDFINFQQQLVNLNVYIEILKEKILKPNQLLELCVKALSIEKNYEEILKISFLIHQNYVQKEENLLRNLLLRLWEIDYARGDFKLLKKDNDRENEKIIRSCLIFKSMECLNNLHRIDLLEKFASYIKNSIDLEQMEILKSVCSSVKFLLERK